jgi:hypothetical protein
LFYRRTLLTPREGFAFDAASLPVFCAHLVIVPLALAAIGDKQGATPLLVDVALLSGSFAVLYAIAGMYGRVSHPEQLSRLQRGRRSTHVRCDDRLP